MKQELKLIKRILWKHDNVAADCLVRAYYNEIYVYVYKQVADKEMAMDITQEIFISALQSLFTYDEKKASFRTWLYRIATNKIIDYRRIKNPLTIEIEECLLPDPSFFTLKVEQGLLIEEIENFVSKMEIILQRIFRLRVYGEYSFPEIANMLDRPEASVKSSYYRLISLIRKEFQDEDTNAGK